MNSDFKELLSIFNTNHVKYLIIGGYAVSEYAEPRYTKDLDIWVEASIENGEKVYKSLKEFKAPLFELTQKDFSEEGSFYQMGRPPVRVDILMSIEGRSFTEAWQNRQIIDFFGIQANFVSLEDLIGLKKLAGRPQDLADVENLLIAKKVKENL
jgi:predicted nucleotidyltransferase